MATAAISRDEAMKSFFGPKGHEDLPAEKPKEESTAVPAAEPAAAAPAPAPAAPAPEKPAAQPAAAAPKPAKKRPTATPRHAAPEVSITDRERERIAADAAARAAAMTADERGQRLDRPTAVPAVELDPEDQDELRVLGFLARTNPKYANIDQRMQSFYARAAEYKKKWETDNPGREFKPDDADHDTFYSEHEPQYDKGDFKRAEKDMLKREIEQDMTRKQSEEKRLDAERKRLETESGQIEKVSEDAMFDVIKTISPDVAKLFEKDGKVLINDEVWAKLEEEDPAACLVLKRHTDFLSRQIIELERLTRYRDTYPVDPKNDIHRGLYQLAMEKEEAISKLSKEEQRDDAGRAFMRQVEYDQRISNIVESGLSDPEIRTAIASLEKKYWILENEHLKVLAVGRAATRAKRKLAEMRKVEEAVKKKHSGSAAAKPPSPTPEPAKPAAEAKPAPAAAAAPEPQPAATPRSRPPNSASAADRLPSASEGKPGSGSAAQTLDRTMWS